MKVTIVTATTGNPLLAGCIESVRKQTHGNMQHYIIVDGPDRLDAVNEIFMNSNFPNGKTEFVLSLPYAVGKDRWNGHRMYGAACYMTDGDYIMFLDEDNSIEPTHVEDCLKVIEAGNQWAFSFRKIVNKQGNLVCKDDCESLGKWPSVLHPEDYFVDVNCFFLPRLLAVQTSPIWYRKAREPGVPEVDRALTHVLRQIAPKYDSTYNYTVNYLMGATERSPQASFFEKGNVDMLVKYDGKLPWKK
jgi:glycosyltransferase involved in cell wall biosynthesis